MNNIVKEENFIKNESQKIDECLNRCKNLANMMVTMKKLAMVQDPTINNQLNQTNKTENLIKDTKLTGVATTTPTTATIQNDNLKTEANDFLCLFNLFINLYIKNSMLIRFFLANKNIQSQKNYFKEELKAHALDNILDELNLSLTQNNQLKKQKLNNFTQITPPKPPER